MELTKDAPKGLVCKLAEIVAEINHVEKKGRNEFQKYSYVKAADLANVVRQKLSARKILMLSDVIARESVQVQAKDGGTWMFDNIDVLYTFLDGETGETLCFKMPGTGADKGDKAVYKAITGSLKYALRNAFLVPDEAADPEADESTDKEAGKQAAAAIAAQKVAQSRSKAVSSAPVAQAWGNVIFFKRDVLADSGPVLWLTGEPLVNKELVAEWNELFFAFRSGDAVVVVDEYEEELKAACQAKGLKLVESSLPEVSGEGAAVADLPSGGLSAPIVDYRGGPLIESYKETITKQKQTMAFVKWDGQDWGCFHADLFPFLKAGVGKPAQLITKVSGKYQNIEGIIQIGSQKFHENKPELQRREL